jgi:hypothetical protein
MNRGTHNLSTGYPQSRFARRRRPQSVNKAQDLSEQGLWNGDLGHLGKNGHSQADSVKKKVLP